MDRPVAPGRSFTLGATLRDGGANFSVFSKHGIGVELCLFDRVDDARSARVIALDPRMDCTYHYWHVFVPDIAPGQLHAFRVHGLFDPANGRRFDASKVLLDPYGKCIARPAAWSRQAARRPGDNAATAFKSVVVDPGAYDWEGDVPRHPTRQPRCSGINFWCITSSTHIGRRSNSSCRPSPKLTSRGGDASTHSLHRRMMFVRSKTARSCPQ
jgi:pullulanase/glycogen debranching enzyme